MSPGHGKGCVSFWLMKKEHLIALGIFVVVGVILMAILVFFVVPQTAVAPRSLGDLDAQTLQVAKGLYCPVCPGTPLDVCETTACQQWRELIKTKLSQGESPAQINAYFVRQYGERVLGAPQAQGWNLLVYALPAFAVSGGAALLYLFVQRRVHKPATAPIPAGGQDEYRARIERELHENE